MKYYPYEEFKNDTKKLLLEIKEFEPEAIVAIVRGGLSLAHALSEGLEIRNVQSLRTELYDGCDKRDTLSIFGSCLLDGKKRVVVVDDIADSGDTLKAVMEYLNENFKDIEFRTATLFYKKTSIYEPHYWAQEANDWIDFFWERDFKE